MPATKKTRTTAASKATKTATGGAKRAKKVSKVNITRELVLIDMALAAGAGLGAQVHRMPLEGVEYWATYFSGTVARALRGGDDWTKSRKNAKAVGERMGMDAARRLAAHAAVSAQQGRAIAHAAQQQASLDPQCPVQGGAGKFC